MPDTFVSPLDQPRFELDRHAEAGLEHGLHAFLAGVLCACRDGVALEELREFVGAGCRAAKQIIELEASARTSVSCA